MCRKKYYGSDKNYTLYNSTFYLPGEKKLPAKVIYVSSNRCPKLVPYIKIDSYIMRHTIYGAVIVIKWSVKMLSCFYRGIN